MLFATVPWRQMIWLMEMIGEGEEREDVKQAIDMQAETSLS